MSRSDSIRQRTKQNGVGSNIDAVSLEILALMSITKCDYWAIELGDHTHLYWNLKADKLSVGYKPLAKEKSARTVKIQTAPARMQLFIGFKPHLANENAVVANGAKPLCTAIHIGGLPLQVGPVARRRSLFHLIREVFKELILALGRRNCEDVI